MSLILPYNLDVDLYSEQVSGNRIKFIAVKFPKYWSTIDDKLSLITNPMRGESDKQTQTRAQQWFFIPFLGNNESNSIV